MRTKLVVLCCSIMIICSGFSAFGQPIKLDKYLPKNTVRDGSVDYTTYLQKGLDENLNIEFPNFPILINEGGLNLRSNHTLNFGKNSILIMKPNSKEKYGLLNLIGISKVVINNPNLKGDRDKHIGSKGEWGMGINILSSQDVIVNNSKISKFWGDGIYVGEIPYSDRHKYNLGYYYSKNINLIGGTVDNNRRNGISVISVKGMKIENLVSQNTSGTLPMAGICFEPNNNGQILENITLSNVTTKNNKEVGLKYVASSFLGSRDKDVSITVKSFKDYGSKVGLYIGGARSNQMRAAKKLNGTIKVIDCNLFDNIEPIKYGSIQKLNPTISVSSLKIYKNKTREGHKESSMISELGKKGIKVDNFAN